VSAPHAEPGGGDLRPIPWLEQAGPAPALDGKPGPGGVAAKPLAAKPVAAKPVADKPAPRRLIRGLVWARRVSQAAFLGLFCFLLLQTAFRGTFADASNVRLPYPVEGFLWFDPFVAAITLFASHDVYRGLAWSLGIVVVTVIVGRGFCGWVCPLGTLHHFAGWLWPSRAIRSKRRVEVNRSPRFQSVKYYVLYACLAAALTGSAIGGLLDPICIAVRALGLGVLPLVDYAGIRVADAAIASNLRPLQAFGDATRELVGAVTGGRQSYTHDAWLIVSGFAAILFMNRVVPRFWCRVLCPLGALLGWLSRFAWFGMEKDHAKCTDCNLCLVHCQGADSPEGGVKHRRDECHLCFNCEAACPEGVIRFRFFPKLRSISAAPDLSRRTTLAASTAAVVGIGALRIGEWPDRNYSPKVIRPPGSVDERDFLERCIRCAECMKVCPNNALHPASFEAGIEGLWTPILIPRIGYCELSCVLCGQVCPTGAIQKITEPEKMGIGQKPISIGTAMFDTGRCLPWSMATPCIVCEEFCPTSPKAIWTEEVTVPARRDLNHPDVPVNVTVQRPRVDPALCIGCGACEKVCPIVDRPAVYVTSAGETRSKTNVILLENSAYR
jgi:polyferredoxin